VIHEKGGLEPLVWQTQPEYSNEPLFKPNEFPEKGWRTSQENIQLYVWHGLHWDIEYDINGNPYSQTPLCPKQKCNCRIIKDVGDYKEGEYHYRCNQCDFQITLKKKIEDVASDLLEIVESQKYKGAEIINIDGELIRVQREEATDNDYWVDVKLSKGKKGGVQLMVLAGSKNSKDKAQLFLDPKNERLAFDQNNDHPSKIFAKVVGIFKNSKSEIHFKDGKVSSD
jgi:hypothetical protein